jgi:transposase
MWAVTEAFNDWQHARGATALGGRAQLCMVGRNRRLSKDYEMLPCSSEAFVYLAMIRLMLKRLGKQEPFT